MYQVIFFWKYKGRFIIYLFIYLFIIYYYYYYYYYYIEVHISRRLKDRNMLMRFSFLQNLKYIYKIFL